MIKRELIRKTEEFLRQRFDAAIYLNQHPDAKAYRIEHTYRVANIGRQIALREGFDVYRIHETLAGDRFLEKSLEEKFEYAEKRLARLRQLENLPMATGAAEELWRARLAFYIAFYEKLAEQIKNSTSIID